MMLSTRWLYLVMCAFINFILANAELPQLLVIAFDGLRVDSINEELMPNLYKFSKTGVFAEKGMKTVFPSITMPNFYSMSTGLFPKDSGIVGNVFFDLNDGDKKYDYWDFGNDCDVKNQSKDEHWYFGEPIYFINEAAGASRKTACQFWPACNRRSSKWPHVSYSVPWGHHMDADERKQGLEELLSKMIGSNLHNFGMFYVQRPDEEQHYHGLDGNETITVIHELDELFGYLLVRVENEESLSELNIILLSDHVSGHVKIDLPENILNFDEVVPRSIQAELEFGADWSFHPKTKPIHPKEIQDAFWNELYANLSNAPAYLRDHYSLYRRNDSSLNGFHWVREDRVGPVILILDPGYDMAWNKSIDDLWATYWNTTSIASHGYTNEDPGMNGVFVAGGPAFKSGVKLTSAFQNLDVYPLFAHILNIPPGPNNGTLVTFQSVLAASPANDSTNALGSAMHFLQDTSASIMTSSLSTVVLVGTGMVLPIFALSCYCFITLTYARKHSAFTSSKTTSFPDIPMTQNESRATGLHRQQQPLLMSMYNDNSVL